MTHTLTPGGAAAAGGTVNLLRLPNSGSVAASLTETQVSAVAISVSLASVSGTAVDAQRGIGLAYSYEQDQVAFFNIADKREIATYSMETSNVLDFSGGGGKIVGAVMNPANQTAILATADGYEIVDYSTPTAPKKLREIASVAVAGADGIEINENFGFHPALSVGGASVDLILSGGRYDESASPFPLEISNGNSFEVADANSGVIYRPDSTTQALFTHGSYVDAISVDVNYHVAVLAPEHSKEKVLVDLNQLSLDSATGTYSLPATAVAVIETGGEKYTNIAVESVNHLVMMGEGYGGSSLMVAELQDPAVALGFKSITSEPVVMPIAADQQGNEVYWFGSFDPHGAGAYATGADHPTKPKASIGLWASGSGEHIAVIDLRRVLDGQLAEGSAYDPVAATPSDIVYIATGQNAGGSQPDPGQAGPVAVGTLTVTGTWTGGQSLDVPMIVGVALPFPQVTAYLWSADPAARTELQLWQDGTSGSFIEASFTIETPAGALLELIADCSTQACPIQTDMATRKATFDNLVVTDDQGVSATLTGELPFAVQ